MEQMQTQMGRFLEGRDFESFEQMTAAMDEEFNQQPFDPNRSAPRTPLEEAQNLCYEAFEARGRRQLQLARQALEICPDCADAYVLLAERTSDLPEAAELYGKAVATGERTLGREMFEKEAGHFWGMVATRPYMRARLGLAQTLENLGEVEEAVGHYRELLRLNPGDNQGVRYLLLPRLLELGRDAEAARFMKDCEDEPTANWTYTRALLAYRLGGDTSTSRKEIREAIKINPFVVECLAEDAEPYEMPGSYSPGSCEEAVICAEELRPAVVVTPGAMEWLEEQGRANKTQRRSKHRKKRKRRSR